MAARWCRWGGAMDEAEFDAAVKTARKIIRLVDGIVGEDPAAWTAWYYRQLEDDGERPSAAVDALVREATDPERRSSIAARAVLVYTGEAVEVPTKKGPKPEDHALRNLAILTALWFLSERLGLHPTRNRSKGEHCAAEGGSACDVVGAAKLMGYKRIEQIWNRRGPLIRQHPLFFMALWAALPTAEFLGVRSTGTTPETVTKLLGRIPPQ